MLGGKAGNRRDNDDGTNAIQASFRDQRRGEKVPTSVEEIYICECVRVRFVGLGSWRLWPGVSRTDGSTLISEREQPTNTRALQALRVDRRVFM